MSEKTGGSAFPFEFTKIFRDGTKDHIIRDGMMLRDYFASQALLGLIAGHHSVDPDKNAGRTVGEVCAERAYSYADFMLQERAK